MEQARMEVRKSRKKKRKMEKRRWKKQGDEKEVKKDERQEKVSRANWEAWLYLQPILWSHSSAVMTRRSGLRVYFCECVWVTECLRRVAQNKISSSSNCTEICDVRASACNPLCTTLALHCIQCICVLLHSQYYYHEKKVQVFVYIKDLAYWCFWKSNKCDIL